MAPARAITTRKQAAARQALHASSSLIPVAYACGVGRRTMLEVLAVVLAAALTIELLRWANPSVRTQFERLMGPLLREAEHAGITGATWLALSLAGAALVLPLAPAVAAMWCVCAGDPFAAFVGSAWQARRWRYASPHRGRSLAGSVAMATVSTAGVALFAGLTPGRAAIVGLTAAVAERAAGRLNDNITIVLGAGLAALVVT